jgi:MFS family permease
LNVHDGAVANRILIDLGPLRERRGFRLLFAGTLVEMFGSQFTAVAVPFQVYALTRSSFQVGLVSLAQLIPLIIGALIGGAVGDAVDRRYDRRTAPLSWSAAPQPAGQADADLAPDC